VKLPALLLLFAAWAFPAEVEIHELPHRLPRLISVFPQGARPGTRLSVEILGEFLDRASSVMFLDGSVSGKVVDVHPTSLTLEFSVSDGATYGPHYFRVLSPRGASNVLLFRIGDLPHITEQEPNSTFAEANSVEPPVTINGRLNLDGDFDFYRFRAEAGQTWIFDLRAARNGNGLDAALILLDEQAREITRNEDYFIWDPFIEYKFERSGTYTVVVQPTHTQLDPNFTYQLDIRNAPHIETVSPISTPPGTSLEVSLYGAGLLDKSARLVFTRDGAAPAGFSGRILEARDSSALIHIDVPGNARAGAYELALVTPTGRSDTAMFLIDPTPVYKGTDTIQPPVSITGTAHYRDAERFRFDAKKGQALVFEVRAHRFGSPVDSVLRILDEKGKQLAMNDDGDFPGVADNKDSRIFHTFAADGRYQVEMRNLVRVTGENFPYQLLVYPPTPHANIMLAGDQPYVDADGSGVIKVAAERLFGFDEPLELSVAGLPEGVSAEPAVIPPGKTDASIPLHARGANPGVYSNVQVFAKGMEEPAWRSVKISGGEGEGQTFARVDRATLVVSERPLFALEAEVTRVNLVRGGNVDIPVQIQRAKDFAADIHFQVEGLPPGVTAEPLIVHDGLSNVKIRLTASSSAATGRTKEIAVIGTAAGHVEEAPIISVQVD
jgi:hypothetical protein